MNPRLLEIRVLNRFRPYLRVLQAFNHENFHHHDWRSTRRSIYYGCFSFLIGTFTATVIFLSVWFLIDNDCDFGKLVVLLPLQMSIIQMGLTFLPLVKNNRIINETIERIQLVVEKREYAFRVFLSISGFPPFVHY